MKFSFVVFVYLSISFITKSQECNVVEIKDARPEFSDFSCYNEFLINFNQTPSNKIAFIYYKLVKNGKNCIYVEIDTTNSTANILKCNNESQTSKQITLKDRSYLESFQKNNRGRFLVMCDGALYGDKIEGVLIKVFNSTYEIHSYDGSLKKLNTLDSTHIDIFEYFKKYFDISIN